MNNSNRSNTQSSQRQFLMQDLQINAFSEVSKIVKERIAKSKKRSKK